MTLVSTFGNAKIRFLSEKKEFYSRKVSLMTKIGNIHLHQSIHPINNAAMTSRLITPQLAEQFKQYPLYSQDGKKLNARNINIIKKIENEHDKAIAYHDTVAPKMEEKSSKKELLFIRYNN